jgi:hypothetical protein
MAQVGSWDAATNQPWLGTNQTLESICTGTITGLCGLDVSSLLGLGVPVKGMRKL